MLYYHGNIVKNCKANIDLQQFKHIVNTESNFDIFTAGNMSINAHAPIDRHNDHIILFSSNKAGLRDFSEILKRTGTKFSATSDLNEAKDWVKTTEFDAIMIDVTALDEQGMNMIRWVRANGVPDMKVYGFTRTHFYDILMDIYHIGAEGVFYFEERSTLSLARVLFNLMIHNPHLDWTQVITANQGFVSQRIRSQKDPNAPILLKGPEGAGKIALAVVAHSLSGRKDGPFIVADCIPYHVFNYVASFQKDTAKNRDMLKRSYLKLLGMAKGGTIYFRSFDKLPEMAQQVLASVISSKKCIASDTGIESGFVGRIILSTNINVDDYIKEGIGERALLYLAAHNTMIIPSLFEFRNEVPKLAQEIVNDYVFRMNGKPVYFSPGALRKLEEYDWPGNLQELYDVVTVALSNHKSGKIDAELIVFPENEKHDIPEDKERLLKALIDNRWNKTKVGTAMGYGRNTVTRRIEEYNLPKTWKEWTENQNNANNNSTTDT